MFVTFEASGRKTIMKFQHAFFDLDGTLIDSKRGIFNSVQYSLDSLRIPFEDRPSDLNPFIGPPLRDSFMNLFHFSAEFAEKATTKYREYYSTKGLYEYELYNGIPEALEMLSGSGLLLSVVTSKAEIYAKLIIKSTGLNYLFQTVTGCEIDGRRSDKQELILYTLDKLKLKASSKSIMVGDRFYDIRGARKTGISSCAVTYGYGPCEELMEEKPDIIINSPDELRFLAY